MWMTTTGPPVVVAQKDNQIEVEDPLKEATEDLSAGTEEVEVGPVEIRTAEGDTKRTRTHLNERNGKTVPRVQWLTLLQLTLLVCWIQVVRFPQEQPIRFLYTLMTSVNHPTPL